MNKKEKMEYEYGAYLNKMGGRVDPWTCWFNYYNALLLGSVRGKNHKKENKDEQ